MPVGGGRTVVVGKPEVVASRASGVRRTDLTSGEAAVYAAVMLVLSLSGVFHLRKVDHATA